MQMLEVPDPLTPAEPQTPAAPAWQPPELEITMSAEDIGRWKGRFDPAIEVAKEIVKDNKESVNFRVAAPGGNTESRIALIEDHARTRQKVSQLLFDVPEVALEARSEAARAFVPTFDAVLDDKLQGETEAAYELDEALNDMVNGAGFGAILTSYKTYSEPRTLRDGQSFDYVHAQCYEISRISPGMVLRPREVKRSNWNKAPWLGVRTYMPVVEAKRLGWVPPDFKATEVAPKELLLSADVEDADLSSTTDYVCVLMVWYRATVYDPAAYHPDHFRRIVWVDNKPVVHEDMKWQKYVPPVDPTPEMPAVPETIDAATGAVIPAQPAKPATPGRRGYYVGVKRHPLQIVTSGYVSDMATPPSDSKISRGIVREIMRGKRNQLKQQDHSIPARWADVNRIDTATRDQLKRGDYQGWIFVNGDGNRAIGEVARAQFPRESMAFMQDRRNELDRGWGLTSPAALSNDGDASATEIKDVKATADDILQYQRARVLRWFTAIAENLGGLLQMFATQEDFIAVRGPDGAQVMTQWDRTTLPADVVYKLRPDSSVRIDVNQKISNLLKLYNLAGKDPNLNRQSVLREIIELTGLDARRTLQPPPPEKKEPPNVSFRFGGQDLLNPIAVATMIQAGIQITPQIIADAQKMIADAGLQPIVVPAGGNVEAMPVPQLEVGGTQSALPPGYDPASGAHPGDTPEVTTPIAKRLDGGARLT